MAITVARTPPLAAPTGAAAVTGSAAGDLTNGVTYYYRIAATTSTGWGLPGIPCAEVSAAADANGSVDLSWNAVSGAAAYIIWRTGVSGSYAIVYNNDADLNPDVDMMCLRNGRSIYANPYTTTAIILTDTGSATTNTSTRPTHFSCRDNQRLNETGRGYITLSGGTDGAESNFDDIYTDAVANGYTANFNRIYSKGGYRIFECIDDISLTDYFKDSYFKIIIYGKFMANADTDTKTFGEQVASVTTDDITSGDSEIVFYSPVGRQVSANIAFENSNLYGVKILQDPGVSRAAHADRNSIAYNFHQGGSISFESNCTLKNIVLNCAVQQVIISTYQDWDCVDLFKVYRGLYISASQSDSVFKKVRIYTHRFGTTGSHPTELNNSTFYKDADYHRFYNINDISRTLVDCIFPNGHGLPASASNGGGAKRNVMWIKWSFDLLVTKIDKTPINGATVKIVDNQANTTNLTTDVNGNITTQKLTEASYNRATETDGNFDTTVDYNPYTITISKPGYQTYEKDFTLDDTTAWTIRLIHTAVNPDQEAF